MLHIVNGDATVARLTPAALPGDVLVWRDVLVEGPVERDRPVDVLATLRAPWLSRRLGIPADEYVANGRAQAAGLAAAVTHDEIVLWFEQDLFCVANLAHLAAWLRAEAARGRVSLIFPAEPLGTTDAVTLATLFADRRPFTEDAIADAASWWDAYAAPDPGAFDRRPARGAVMFLDAAARLHLSRFPAVENGLGAVEASALAALDGGARPIAEVYREAVLDARMRRHGMSDLQFAAHLRALGDGPTPLVTLDDSTVAITPEGRAVRDGTRDRLDAQALDWWLGGARLAGHDSPWRWDARRGTLQ